MKNKIFSPLEVVLEIKKTLNNILMKSDPVLKEILSDMSDKNSAAQVSKDKIPAGGENVLNKIDGLQQTHIKPPTLSNNVPANLASMKIKNSLPKTPAGFGGGSGPKKPKKPSISSGLKGFMQKKEEKREAGQNVNPDNYNKTDNLMEKAPSSPSIGVGGTAFLPFKAPKISLPKDPVDGV